MIKIDQIKQLREETGVSVQECKKALEGARGNMEGAKELLKKLGKEMAQKKASRIALQGIVDSYIHPTKKIGAIIKLQCETDFVAKSPDFQKLSHELCLQVAALDPKEIPVLEQPWIKDPSKTIKDLLEEHVAKLGENIVLTEFTRYAL